MAALVAAATTVLCGGGVAHAGGDACVSVSGRAVVDRGSSTCSSVADTGNVAVALHGGSATAGAEASDTLDKARARGDGAPAFAGSGSHTRAVAAGASTLAEAFGGDGNTAVASGNACAYVNDGSDNLARATGENALARAGSGDGNTATATGDCTALATRTGVTTQCPGP